MALELKCVIEINLIRVSFRCISRSFHFNNYFKQLYISNKTECFSYKVGVARLLSMQLEEELARVID